MSVFYAPNEKTCIGRKKLQNNLQAVENSYKDYEASDVFVVKMEHNNFDAMTKLK